MLKAMGVQVDSGCESLRVSVIKMTRVGETHDTGLRKIHLLHNGGRDFRNAFEMGLVPLSGLARARKRHEVRVEMHRSGMDMQSPKECTLVHPRQVAVQVVEVKGH
jgi:hypothetical protein